ncbi:MAG: hypothetical protein AMJ78_00950 [Omnitrophica WOR_2 bacterium SM23_29]|nr:MAG: hypothetical protein AMJ78_00950 [Omnitrophica WOR_2 bacterium SM23_29]
MKILLIFPNWTMVFGAFSSVAKRASSFPPLNLALLGAVAEKSGHTVQIIDAELENLTDEQVLKRVQDFSPDIIGFTATTPMFHIVVNLAYRIKKVFQIPIILGGTHATILKEKAFNDCFDYLFVGEAEETFALFLEAFEKAKGFSSIPGLLLREDGNILFTGTQNPIADLDRIPFPARHLLKSDRYKTGTLRGKKIYTSIMFSRGCPYQCVYCCIKVFGRKVRKRSVINLVTEIESVINQFGIRHFCFVDDTLTLNRNYILNLCDEIDRRKLKITFDGSTRANLVDEELIRRLANSGLIRISFGLESGDPEILKIIKKEVPLESYIKANKLTRKYGIETNNSVMLGLPGETRESINKTISFLRNTKEIQEATYSIAMPYPGTEFYEMAKKGEHGLKLHTEDFSKYQRYESAVLSVNDMSPEEIMHLQKKGLLMIYFVPWRILPMIRRFGILALLSPLCASVKSFVKSIFHKKGRNIKSRRC